MIRGHAAAFKYWLNAFGHTGPYSQKVEVVNGIQKIIPKGNPMECPGRVKFCPLNVLNDLVVFILLVLFSNCSLANLGTTVSCHFSLYLRHVHNQIVSSI